MDATDAQFVRPGVAAQIRLNGSESVRRGVVERTESDPALRTIRVRIRLLDYDAELRANRAATVIIDGPGNKSLAVPREALIRTATRTAVIRVRADGGFEPVSVTIGREFGEQIEIRSGLKDGDRIVTSGQFLLDSEASLRSGLDRLAPAAETTQ
jgi:Cu(I)/Ag(I) efflux system membrane fusion protein